MFRRNVAEYWVARSAAAPDDEYVAGGLAGR